MDVPVQPPVRGLSEVPPGSVLVQCELDSRSAEFGFLVVPRDQCGGGVEQIIQGLVGFVTRLLRLDPIGDVPQPLDRPPSDPIEVVVPDFCNGVYRISGGFAVY
jgi:hypothetical protein